MMKSHRAALLLSILLAAGALLPIFPLPAAAQNDSSGQSQDTPERVQPIAERKPGLMRWKIVALAGAAVVSLTLLAFAAPRWRSWNLFDRQYRFPRVEAAALRLGGNRSGGCMATMEFRRGSTAEDT